MRERDKQIRLAGCFAIAECILPFSILAYKGFRQVMTSDYVVLGGFPNVFMEICQADGVKYLELCDKYFIGWMRKQAPAGRKTRLRVCIFDAAGVKSAFLLLLTKVTKHIPPQTSPVGSSLAGI